MVRSASLTAALFGNAVATSDSSTAILDVAALAVYLPRTKPLGKSEKRPPQKTLGAT